MSQPPTMNIIQDGSVVVTPKDMYNELRNVHDAVQTLTTTVNSTVVNGINEIKNDVSDHEKRIRVIEEKHTVSPAQLWTAVVTGIGTVGVIAGIILGVLKL